jgi:endonuclease G
MTAQRDEARARVEAHTDERLGKIEDIRALRLQKADDPRRIAARIDRLSRFYADVRPVDPADLVAGAPESMTQAGKILERIINTPDFVDVRYLEAGVRSAKAVGRVDIRDGRGRVIGYGTGSMVSPRLLLTNHHVLPDAVTAGASAIEFDYQDGIDGQPLQPKLFGFDPAAFFMTSDGLDFTLVAVAGTADALAPFGFNQLIRAEGKAIVGDFVTIIQHPRGGRKQVALRENRIVDVVDDFLHYEADTEPGSSGSPVFNDQWELVALHHASVAAPSEKELGGYVNEGVRVSRFAQAMIDQATPAQQSLLGETGILEALQPVGPVPLQPPDGGTPAATSTSAGPGGGRA